MDIEAKGHERREKTWKKSPTVAVWLAFWVRSTVEEEGTGITVRFIPIFNKFSLNFIKLKTDFIPIKG